MRDIAEITELQYARMVMIVDSTRTIARLSKDLRENLHFIHKF
jgi:hypothetical protein